MPPRRRTPGRRPRPEPAARRRRWPWLLLALALLLPLLDALYLALIWPDWQALASGPAPRSAFMHAYEEKRRGDRSLPALSWQPVPLARIAPSLRRAVIVAEDSRFYQHAGVDLDALREAAEYNWEKGKVVYGASTISQQTAKNLFLSPSRNPLRKWHELVLTWGLEHHLPKRRILELYLNVAEFGTGLYGAEAAARHYWGISAASLSQEQAIELAATLPGPRHDNPHSRSRAFLSRKAKIGRHLGWGRSE